MMNEDILFRFDFTQNHRKLLGFSPSNIGNPNRTQQQQQKLKETLHFNMT